MRLIGVRKEATNLFAPFGVKSFLGTSITANKSFLIHEIIPPLSKKSLDQSVNPITIEKDKGCYLLTKNELFSVSAVPIKHTVFCLGYIIQEAQQRGRY